MFVNEEPLNRLVSAIISICAVLFITAMILFSLAGLGFLFATLCNLKELVLSLSPKAARAALYRPT
jgi:hypothetical protein